MFGIGTKKAADGALDALPRVPPPYVLVLASQLQARDPESAAAITAAVPACERYEFITPVQLLEGAAVDSRFVLSLFIEPGQLDALADRVLAARQSGRDTSLIVAINGKQLTALGRWLERRANENRLAGVRLLLAETVESVARQLPERLLPVREDNVIHMPVTPEVENTQHRNFYVFSPGLQALVARMRAFAHNGINRAYLLGGPGSGKTSLAFYYWLVRRSGRFVAVNLLSENTGDKAAVKSLLCGHVSGAFPGAGARIGAFAQARDGVCFLDEAHSITGPVMEVLMEALDNGQYLPFGAAAKQPLECALLFASNRSWQTLQNSVNLDEFTRMGAAVLQVPELTAREEDMIAVVATTLARLADRCTSWKAPLGISEAAWQLIRNCRWHGNVRGLVRALEAAFIDTATRTEEALIQPAEMEQGIALWEPQAHHSHQLYAAA
jgi:DNA-binding NtrC family response regulator